MAFFPANVILIYICKHIRATFSTKQSIFISLEKFEKKIDFNFSQPSIVQRTVIKESRLSAMLHVLRSVSRIHSYIQSVAQMFRSSLLCRGFSSRDSTLYSADRLFILAWPIKTNNFRSSRGCTRPPANIACPHSQPPFISYLRIRLPVIFLFHVSPTFLGLNKYFVNSVISGRIILLPLLLLPNIIMNSGG